MNKPLKLAVVAWLASTLALSACSTGTSKAPECPDGFDPNVRPELIGLSLVEATQVITQEGGQVRVAYDGDKDIALTADYQPERVNLALHNNTVLCSYLG